jgi:TP901 family phage tail tape measure protein
MEQNPIRYQDLIAPDDSIEKLIGQLEQLQEAYKNMADSIKSQAKEVADSLSKVSGATEQGRKKIKESSEETTKLEKAYKRLDEAMSANGKEIQRLNRARQEYVRYQKNMQQRGKEEIRTMQQIKEASYQQLSAQYSLNKAYINSLSATDRRIAKNRELIKSTKEIYEQMKRLQADTGKMQLNVGNYPMLGGLLGGLGGKALGLGGAAAAGVALAGVVKDNIDLARDYEKTLSVLAAILGTTKEGVQELSEQAQHLGATTSYTAKDVAELQIELAKLGYTTDQIQNMAPAVLDFAKATGSSLADAASLAGAALRMFEKDTTHTTEFVDKMSAATTKSALSFTYLDNAMSTVAPVANAFGFKIEEVLALLGQLANAGFDASSAATATRNILLNLADANGKLAQALGEPVTNLDDLMAGLVKLNDRGIDLGETLELTDKRSVAAFNTFLSGTDNVIKLRDELASCDGYAQQMAKTMGDNLDGSLKSLSSAWEGFNLHLNQSNGLLRTLVDWLTKAVRWIDKLLISLDEYINFDTSKEGVIDRLADKYGDGTSDKVGTTVQTENKATGGTNSTKTNTQSTKGQKAAQAAVNAALKEQERQEKESLNIRRKYEDVMLQLIEDESVKQRTKIIQEYDRQIEDLRIKLEKEKTLTVDDKRVINEQIVALEQIKQVKLADLLQKEADAEKKANDKKKKDAQQAAQQTMRERERAIELEHDLRMEEIEQIDTSEKEKTRMRLEAEKERLQKLLALYQQDGKKLADEEIALIKKQIEGVDKELEKNKTNNKDIYDILGFHLSDEKKKAIDESLQYALDSVNQFMEAYLAAADAKREAADAEVERTQKVLDAEIEARNKGYANDVETARKELEEAKKNQQKAIAEQKKAQKAQEAIQTAQQVSSLVTAVANIWSSFTSMGPWGVALAVAMTALMFGTFAASKIQAREAAGSGDEKYAEGTVEMLEGGSHQSGNDIDLGRKKDGTRRRAEGGEFFAVINKRNSRKYRGIIPDVINSLNNGTFAEKYMNAYDGGSLNIQAVNQGQDLTRLSDDVRSIREQGERRQQYTDASGNTVIVYKNLKRVVRNERGS